MIENKPQILNTTLNLMLKNKSFNIFHQEITLQKHLIDVINDFNKYGNFKGSYSNNKFYCFSENKTIFLTNAATNFLYLRILEHARSFAMQIPESCYDTGYRGDFDEIIEHILDNIIIKEPENSKGKKIEVFVSNIFKPLCFNKKNKKNTVFIIQRVLSDFFVKNQRKNKGSLEVSRSNVIQTLGMNIIRYIITIYPKINSFSYKIDPINNKIFNESEKKIFKSLLENLNKKKSQCHFYKELDVHNLWHQQIIEIYIKQRIMSFVSKHGTSVFKFQGFELYAKLYEISVFEKIHRKLYTKAAQIGSFILNGLLEKEVCRADKKNKGKKSMWYITITNLNLFQNLLRLYLIKKPWLNTKNFKKTKLKGILKKAQLATPSVCLEKSYNFFDILNKEKHKRVHNNQNTILTMNNKNYKNPFVITRNTKYCIDLDTLNLFLKGLLSGQTYMYLLYDFSEDYFTKLKLKYHNDYFDKALNEIEIFMNNFELSGLSLNDLKYNYLSNNLNYEGKEIIEEIINKVEPYKYTLICILKDAIIYCNFDFFLADSFLDSRGRLYNRESYLNIQNHPLAKIFVKPFNETTNEPIAKVIKPLKNILKNIITYKKAVKEFKNSRKIQRILSENFIYKMFDTKKISEETLSHFLKYFKKENQNYNINFIKEYAKKSKLLWVILATIIRYKNNEIMLEYDANNSGLQMLSILFKDNFIAHECNLMGNTNNDAYLLVLEDFKKLLLDLEINKKLLPEKECLIYSVENSNNLENNYIDFDFIEDISSYAPKEGLDYEHLNKEVFFNIMQRFLTFNIITNIHLLYIVNLIKDYYQIFSYKMPSFENKIMLFKAIPFKEKMIMKKCLEKQEPCIKTFGEYLLTLRVLYKIDIYYKTYPWLNPQSTIWDERDLFKKPLMTLYYNAKSITRQQHFEEFLLKKANIFMEKKQNNSFRYLKHFLDRFFMNYVTAHVQGKFKIKELTKLLVITDTSINIKNYFFEIKIKPLIQHSIQIESRNMRDKSRQQITLKIPQDNLNKPKIRLVASPNIIHSMDAFVVHRFLFYVEEINKSLKKNGVKYNISSYTNHDTFSCSIPTLTLILIKQAYCDLIDEDYLSNCLTSLEKSKKLKELNSVYKEKFKKDFLDKFNPLFMK